MFQVWDIQDGHMLYEGELPSSTAQTFFHIKMKGDNVIGITSTDIYVWSISGRKNPDTGTNFVTVPTSLPVSRTILLRINDKINKQTQIKIQTNRTTQPAIQKQNTKRQPNQNCKHKK